MLTFGIFCVLCFLVTIVFFFLFFFFEIHPFSLLPRNKSRRFQNNTWFSLWVFWEKILLQTNPTFFYLLICLLPYYCLNYFMTMKTSENYRFFDVFRGYGNGTLAWNGLTMKTAQKLNVRHSINRNVFQNKQWSAQTL